MVGVAGLEQLTAGSSASAAWVRVGLDSGCVGLGTVVAIESAGKVDVASGDEVVVGNACAVGRGVQLDRRPVNKNQRDRNSIETGFDRFIASTSKNHIIICAVHPL
jgi:hypothetical protein